MYIRECTVATTSKRTMILFLSVHKARHTQSKCHFWHSPFVSVRSQQYLPKANDQIPTVGSIRKRMNIHFCCIINILIGWANWITLKVLTAATHVQRHDGRARRRLTRNILIARRASLPLGQRSLLLILIVGGGVRFFATFLTAADVRRLGRLDCFHFSTILLTR